MLYKKDRIVELLENIASDEGLEDTSDFHMVEDRLGENRLELNAIVNALDDYELVEYADLREGVLS